MNQVLIPSAPDILVLAALAAVAWFLIEGLWVAVASVRELAGWLWVFLAAVSGLVLSTAVVWALGFIIVALTAMTSSNATAIWCILAAVMVGFLVGLAIRQCKTDRVRATAYLTFMCMALGAALQPGEAMMLPQSVSPAASTTSWLVAAYGWPVLWIALYFGIAVFGRIETRRARAATESPI